MDPASLVFCFDFDGVIGDSVDESTEAAWRHARQLWPDLDFGPDPARFFEPMRRVRPVVETGWENTLLIRTLHEDGSLNGGENPDVGPITDKILSDWEKIRDSAMKEWALDRQELIKAFGEVRDSWISSDLQGWLARTPPLGSVPVCMQRMMEAGADVFVITTKQKRFCAALLKSYGLDLPMDRLFALEDGPKPEVLTNLLQRPALSGKQFHFIEDKLSTLVKVVADPRLGGIKCHFVDWGYNTVRQRQDVRTGVHEGISVLSAKDFEMIGTGVNWLD